MKKIIYSVSVFMFFVLLASCSGKQEEKKECETISVKVYQVERVSNVSSHRYVGLVEAANRSSLSFQINGHVIHKYVQDGQFVQKGQPIAALDTAIVKDAYLAAKATLDRAKDSYKRLQLLHENNRLAETDWMEVVTALKQAESAERMAQTKLSHATVFAPFSGVIDKCDVEVGENVLPGQRLCQLLQIDQVKVSFAVPEKDIQGLVGRKISIKIGALGETVTEGVVSEKTMNVDPFSHMYTAKAILANPQHEKLPGMLAEVHLQSANSRDVLVIPNQSVKILGDEHFVWLLKKDRATLQKVTLGDITPWGLIVTSGLTLGDQVIVEGSQNVSENTKVCVK